LLTTIRKKRSPSRLRTVKCILCGTQFKTRHSQGKYCSDGCSYEGEKKSWRDYGNRNRKVRLAYHRRHYRENRKRINERIAAYRRTPVGRVVAKRASEKSRRKFPEKESARQIVLMAKRKGILKKEPCKKCGAIKVQAHHSDYSKPLDVTWLCVPCHREEHTAVN
jgi:hypothetical protein